MPVAIDPQIESKVLEIQGLFERYVRNAGANCDILGTVGSLIPEIEIPEFGGKIKVPEIFSQLKDGVSDTIKQISQSTKFLQDKITDIQKLISEINLFEGIAPPEIFLEIQEEFDELQMSISGFAEEAISDLNPAIDSYFQLEDGLAQTFDIIRSTNCPIVTDALEAISPGITLYLTTLGDSIRDKSIIRDTVIEKFAGPAIGNIANRVRNIASKGVGRFNEINNINNSIKRIREKLSGNF